MQYIKTTVASATNTTIVKSEILYDKWIQIIEGNPYFKSFL